jgi:hypothetical protein
MCLTRTYCNLDSGSHNRCEVVVVVAIVGGRIVASYLDVVLYCWGILRCQNNMFFRQFVVTSPQPFPCKGSQGSHRWGVQECSDLIAAVALLGNILSHWREFLIHVSEKGHGRFGAIRRQLVILRSPRKPS